jgi:FMN phosphatase YigB (HAD superfamily)
MTNAVRAMVFDADGVIVRPRTWFVHAAERTHNIPRAAFMAFIHGDFKRCTTGELELKDALLPLLEHWQVNVGLDAFIRDWLTHEHEVDTRLLERIARIRARGMPCYLGTNQERHRAAYMRHEMGLRDVLDGVFASCDLGGSQTGRGVLRTRPRGTRPRVAPDAPLGRDRAERRSGSRDSMAGGVVHGSARLRQASAAPIRVAQRCSRRVTPGLKP